MDSVQILPIAPSVVEVRIDRPERRNALDAGTRAALHAAIDRALGDDTVRAIVLSGAGGSFCAGGDVGSLVADDLEAARARLVRAHEFVRTLAHARTPIVAAVEGAIAGAGVGLALWCDTIVAARSSAWSFGFLRVGVAPDYGLTVTLPRRIGSARARECLEYSAAFDGTTAFALGIADELVDDGAALDAARARAERLAQMPREALRATRALLQVTHADLDRALALERELQARCFVSAEAVEGRAAFLEKRAPRF